MGRKKQSHPTGRGAHSSPSTSSTAASAPAPAAPATPTQTDILAHTFSNISLHAAGGTAAVKTVTGSSDAARLRLAGTESQSAATDARNSNARATEPTAPSTPTTQADITAIAADTTASSPSYLPTPTTPPTTPPTITTSTFTPTTPATPLQPTPAPPSGSQASPTTPPRASTSSAAPTTAVPAAPITPAPPATAGTSAPTIDYRQLWLAVEVLHGLEGLPYLEAFIRANPKITHFVASGERDADIVAAARRLCAAAEQLPCRTIALRVVREALTEAVSTLTITHPAALLLSVKHADLLMQSEQWEPALRKWRWLQPRVERLVGGEWEIERVQVRLGLARCLCGLENFTEARQMALGVFNERRRAHGEGDALAIQALQILIDCEIWQPEGPLAPGDDVTARAIQPAEFIPLMQRNVAYLKTTKKAHTNDADGRDAYALERTLRALQSAHIKAGDARAAEGTSLELVRACKTRYGLHDLRYLTACQLHTVNLVRAGQYPKAISLLSDCLNQQVAKYGEKHELTIMAAMILGSAYTAKGDPHTAIRVFKRAWAAAKDCLPADSRAHSDLFEYYISAMTNAYNGVPANAPEEKARLKEEFNDLVSEAQFLRGLPAYQIVQSMD